MMQFLSKPKRFYQNLHLQTKFTISHLVIVLIPMIVLGALFYTKLYDMILADTIRTEQSSSAEIVPMIDDTVQSILNCQQEIFSLDSYQALLTQDMETHSDSSTTETIAQFEKDIQSYIDDSLITDIKMYADLPTTSSTVLPLTSTRGSYWHGIFKGSPTTNILFCPSFYLSSTEKKNYGDLAYITRSANYYKNKVEYSYLAIYFSQELFTSLLQENLSSQDNVTYLINSRDSIITTSNNALSGTYYFSYNAIQDYVLSSNNFISKKVLGEDVYAGFYKINNTDWYMVVALPSTPILEKSTAIISAVIFLYVFCIVVSLLIAISLSHSITNRLSMLINQMGQVRYAAPIALPPSDTTDELGDLIDSYNYMSRVINQLLESQAQAAEDLRAAEFNALQAQINPHFLYNTMDMINWLALQGRTSEVTTAIQNLSRFYKLTLSRQYSLSTVADEIEHISIYVHLQNMRFHNNIDLIIDISDELLDYAIPKLTFQPVIENSILHGILEKESKSGTILLTGWIENEDIIILISDDGIGMRKEILELLLSGRTIPGSTGTNIAVHNTHRRLQVLFGPLYGLKYASTLGEGTEVEIRIPVVSRDQL